MDAVFKSPFIDGVTEMMSAMLGLPCDQCGPEGIERDVSGIIGFAGQTAGQMTLSFPMETARQLVAEMLGMDTEEIDEELLKDGVGEMANIVAGNAKARLQDTSFHFQMGLPSIVVGRNHSVDLFKGAESETVMFATDFGLFEMHITLVPHK